MEALRTLQFGKAFKDVLESFVARDSIDFYLAVCTESVRSQKRFGCVAVVRRNMVPH